MDSLSEEEIIDRIERLFKDNQGCFEALGEHLFLDINRQKLIENLLNLYKKEKELNKKIKNKLEEENIPIETLLAEFDRLEDVEFKLDKEKEKNKILETMIDLMLDTIDTLDESCRHISKEDRKEYYKCLAEN